MSDGVGRRGIMVKERCLHFRCPEMGSLECEDWSAVKVIVTGDEVPGDGPKELRGRGGDGP